MKSPSKIIATGIVVVFVALAVWGWLALSRQVPEGAEGPWGGVDVTVIEKYAIDAGREPSEPFINTDQGGDLLLFVFALGGAVGGFAAGYYWRRLITEKS